MCTLEQNGKMSEYSSKSKNGFMLYSKERNIYAKIDANKVSKGQFNTVSKNWFLPQIRDFILRSKRTKCLDPFAGRGDILNLIKDECGLQTFGLDIDSSLGWEYNDSLLNIPSKYDDCIIVTNPPYLAKYSATRKGVNSHLKGYYSKWEDLYMQALDKCLKYNKYIVAIIPETFLNSNYPKEYCESISIILKNPFTDTDCPVCVLCLTPQKRSLHTVKIYLEEKLISTYGDLKSDSLVPEGTIKIKFNDVNGNIGLRAVDLTGVKDKIQFLMPKDLKYDRSNIKISSRLVTFLSIEDVVDKSTVSAIIDESNKILNEWRARTYDVMLSPFKGNAKDGTRRRRLDYRSARAILELAYKNIYKLEQQTLFQNI